MPNRNLHNEKVNRHYAVTSRVSIASVTSTRLFPANEIFPIISEQKAKVMFSWSMLACGGIFGEHRIKVLLLRLRCSRVLKEFLK